MCIVYKCYQNHHLSQSDVCLKLFVEIICGIHYVSVGRTCNSLLRILTEGLDNTIQFKQHLHLQKHNSVDSIYSLSSKSPILAVILIDRLHKSV